MAPGTVTTHGTRDICGLHRIINTSQPSTPCITTTISPVADGINQPSPTQPRKLRRDCRRSRWYMYLAQKKLQERLSSRWYLAQKKLQERLPSRWYMYVAQKNQVTLSPGITTSHHNQVTLSPGITTSPSVKFPLTPPYTRS